MAEVVDCDLEVGKFEFQSYYYGNCWIIIFTQPLYSGRIWHKVNFFKRSLTGLNSEFSFS